MRTTNETLTCPLCREQHTDTTGHTDGPREYHADCWDKLNRMIERKTNEHNSTDSITIDLRGRLARSRYQDVVDILSCLAGDDFDYAITDGDGYADLDCWDGDARWHVYLD